MAKTAQELRAELEKLTAQIQAAEAVEAAAAETARQRDASVEPIRAFAANALENAGGLAKGYVMIMLADHNADGTTRVRVDYLGENHRLVKPILRVFNPDAAASDAPAATNGRTPRASAGRRASAQRPRFNVHAGDMFVLPDGTFKVVQTNDHLSHLLGVAHYCSEKGADGKAIGGGDSPSKVNYAYLVAHPDARERVLRGGSPLTEVPNA